MSNYYKDNDALKFQLSHPLMKKIVASRSVTMLIKKNMILRRAILKMPLTITIKYWKLSAKLAVKSLLQMPKEWTRKALR